MPLPTVFISYSHKNENEKENLVKHLSVLQNYGLVNVWVDDKIGAGEFWEDEINEALKQAKVAILLITADFLNSSFIKTKEVPEILRRHKKEGLRVFPVIARSCLWDPIEWLKILNVRPKNGKPIWGSREFDVDTELTKIASEVWDILEKIRKDKRKTIKNVKMVNRIAEEKNGNLKVEASIETIEDETGMDIQHKPEKNLEIETVRKNQQLPISLAITHEYEPEMRLIKSGDFLIGNSRVGMERDFAEERPQHKLFLPDFYIATTPITNKQYQAYIFDTNSDPPYHWDGTKFERGKEHYPVVNVSWEGAVDYCLWLINNTGKLYRLPSEAEWEKAARGVEGRIYPWGNHWYKGRANCKEEGKEGKLTPVNAYPNGASPFGILDMVGNAAEWTRSLWEKEFEGEMFEYPYDPNDGRENFETPDKLRRVIRGGSFLLPYKYCRCSYRSKSFPTTKGFQIGFRVVVNSD